MPNVFGGDTMSALVGTVPWPTLEEVLPECGSSPSNPQAPKTTKSQSIKWGQNGSSSYEDDDSCRQVTKKEEADSKGSSSGNRTNPNQGGGDEENAQPSMWERAKQSVNTSFQDMMGGDTCFSAASLSMPCIIGEGFADNLENEAALLGIARMHPPSDDLAAAKQQASHKSRRHATVVATKMASPRRHHEDIEVLPGHKVQVRLPPSTTVAVGSDPKKNRKAPLETLEVRSNMAEIERSISELTMRSSYAAGSESFNKIPDNRRMAYYAVGKNHRQSGRGGNRRCYFTGKLILGGSPFYAGSVQQGLRTLVVFCLPSALGMPDKEAMKKHPGTRGGAGGIISSLLGGAVLGGGGGGHGNATVASDNTPHGAGPHRQHSRGSSMNSFPHNSKIKNRSGPGGTSGHSVTSKSISRLSSLDDLSLSIDGDLDPNWGLDRDFMLKILPPASAKLLKQMSDRFPEQFETLPLQVRDPTKWKLYVKFCFFSGLPITEGEMHYKVLDEVAEQVYGEEIVLSHEVMEAVNGESAEILTLPNQKTFRYLRKHYAQQCSKLDDRVFRRNSWERVAPEV